MAAYIRRIEIFRAKNGKHYFHVRHRNGRISHPSQGYASRNGARRAARRDCPGIPLKGQPS
jgi:uncharacterized protein YegP (UPF0339 family)